MNTATALLLAFNLLSNGTPARVVKDVPGTAVVVIEGRPGCHAEALNGDPNSPVIVCQSRAAKR